MTGGQDPSQPLFNCRTDELPDATLIRLEGEVDLTTAPLLEEAMQRAIDRGRDIILDLSDLTYIASSCLHVLFNGYERLNGRGKRILLAAPSPMVRRILEIVGLHRVFALLPSLEEAWRALRVV